MRTYNMDRTLNVNRAGTLRSRARALLVALSLALSAGVASPVHAQLNENCVVSVLNRNVQAKADGTGVLPNLPANAGLDFMGSAIPARTVQKTRHYAQGPPARRRARHARRA
jgi:hypothetical protein